MTPAADAQSVVDELRATVDQQRRECVAAVVGNDDETPGRELAMVGCACGEADDVAKLLG